MVDTATETMSYTWIMDRISKQESTCYEGNLRLIGKLLKHTNDQHKEERSE